MLSDPSPTGAQRALVAADGYDGYATHAAGPVLTSGTVLLGPSPLEAGERQLPQLPSSPALFMLSPGPNGRERHQLRASVNKNA